MGAFNKKDCLNITINEDGSMQISKIFNDSIQVLDLYNTDIEFLFKKLQEFYKNPPKFFYDYTKQRPIYLPKSKSID